MNYLDKGHTFKYFSRDTVPRDLCPIPPLRDAVPRGEMCSRRPAIVSGKNVIFAKGTSVCGSDPPRQFVRSQIKVLKKNLTNWDLRIGIHLDWTSFWTHFLEKKSTFFNFFLRKKYKKVPQYTHAGNDQNVGNWSFAPPALQGVI